MELRSLRGTGAKVSTICLGTMTLANRSMKRKLTVCWVSQWMPAYFIDTADVYVNGVSETITETFSKEREQIVLASKVGSPSADETRERADFTNGILSKVSRRASRDYRPIADILNSSSVWIGHAIEETPTLATRSFVRARSII